MPQATPSQYPRSDRAHCNFGNACYKPESASDLSVSSVGSSPLQLLQEGDAPARLQGLSVSSVGSSSLQPRGHPSRLRVLPSFSILGRIEPTATRSTACRSPRLAWPFSILGRIEPTATPRPGRAGAGQGRHFQYPRSDRAHCNLAKRLFLKQAERSFSILGRIEPIATTPWPGGGSRRF